LKRYQSPSADHLPTELIHVGGRTFVQRSTNLHALILFGIGKICNSRGRNVLLSLFIKRVMKLAVVIVDE